MDDGSISVFALKQAAFSRGSRMSDEIKTDLKNLARKTETRLAESLLKWKYRKEGKEIPEEEGIRRESERVTEQANRVLSRRGKRAWSELKKACLQPKAGEDKED